MIHLYIPTYNGAVHLENLSSSFPMTIIDNASSDHIAFLCKERGWNLVTYPHTSHRIDNWKRTVNHFIQSSNLWCKWLFTGDNLHENAGEIYQKAIKEYPEARLIIAEYDIVEKGKKRRWSSFDSTKLLQPHEIMELVAKRGNIFGAPIGHCFHREAVVNGFDFGEGSWAADLTFCIHIASHFPVLYLKECVGTFNSEARKTYSSEKNALSSSFEEYTARLLAAKKYADLMNNHAFFPPLKEYISKEIEKLIFERSLSRKRGWKYFISKLVNNNDFI